MAKLWDRGNQSLGNELVSEQQAQREVERQAPSRHMAEKAQEQGAGMRNK
jgi:hypothetical protein